MSNALVTPDRDNVISRLSNWVGGSKRPVSDLPRHRMPDETLDRIGAENEEIKNRCIDVVRKIEELSVLKEHFVEVSNWVGEILTLREQTNAALVERGMMIALAEGALADAKAEARSLHDSREGLAADNNLLQTENERLKGAVRSREQRIESVEAQLHEATQQVSQLRGELETSRDQLFHVRNELQSAQEIVGNNDSLISQLQSDLASARDRSVYARQHAEMLEQNLQESQANAARLQSALSESQIYGKGLADNIREMEITLESERQQLAKTEALLAANQADHLKAQQRWREEKDADQHQLATLAADVDKFESKFKAADSLLAEVRAELQSKVNESRSHLRRAQEVEQKFARLTSHAEGLGGDVSQLKKALEEKDRSYARLSGRAKGLIRAMRDQSALLAKSEQKVGLVSERLTAETDRFEEHKVRFEQTVRDLTEQLEKERLSKMMTAGALEAARQKRLQKPQPAREEPTLADILARADEAHLKAEKGEFKGEAKDRW